MFLRHGACRGSGGGTTEAVRPMHKTDKDGQVFVNSGIFI